MADFHFLRPLWLWALLPVLLLSLGLIQQRGAIQVWSKICDAHLLKPLLVQRGRLHRSLAMTLLSLSMICMVMALSGPAWIKMSVPTYQHLKPRLLLLDLSSAMLDQDLLPDRLSRAKFKIHDLLMRQDGSQYGLMVYSSEPFVVSPITDDAQTIDILLASLTPGILPVDGNHLELALAEAQRMFVDMNVSFGEILVLTAQLPSPEALAAAEKLANQGYHLSVLPLSQDKAVVPLFAPLAKAGRGEVVAFTDNETDLNKWLALTHKINQYQVNQRDNVPLWQDEGRWFLLPGLLLLLPLFRRGWLERIST